MQSLSHDLQAVDFELFNRLDNFAGLRNGLRQAAEERSDWAGIPMPLDGLRLRIEPNYPMGIALEAMGGDGKAPPDLEELPADVVFKNRWWSKRYQADVYVWQEGGKSRCALLPRRSRVTMELDTLFASAAWGIEQEAKAVHLLGTLISHHAFKSYMLTGVFIESSRRSGLTYMFRRLRPTVVIDARSKREDETCKILCALCLHPIGYYDGTWAGSMCPTDDVIAHLMLMRGDEPMFWRRANQHTPGTPEAAI